MKNSAIQWTDHTFNPWIGCTHAKTVDGKPILECVLCYAEDLDDQRFSKTLGEATKEQPIWHWGKGAPRYRTSESYWKQPLAWNRSALQCRVIDDAVWRRSGDTITALTDNGNCVQTGTTRIIRDEQEWTGLGTSEYRPRVFCLSLGDWLDEEVPIEWLADLLALIRATPNLDWLLLTKRPQNWRSRLRAARSHIIGPRERPNAEGELERWLSLWIDGDILNKAPDNIWIGVSAGADQKAALAIPAKIHFLSCEPMLHALTLHHPEPFNTIAKFDWIIFGGESGKLARPLNVGWIRMGLGFCRANKIAAFVKQMGRYIVDRNDAGFEGDEGEWPMDTRTRDIESGYQGAPVRVLLKDSHGGDMSEWPEDLRVREFPKPA